MRTHEGLAVAKAKGRLQGSKPKLTHARKRTWSTCTAAGTKARAIWPNCTASAGPRCVGRSSGPYPPRRVWRHGRSERTGRRPTQASPAPVGAAALLSPGRRTANDARRNDRYTVADTATMVDPLPHGRTGRAGPRRAQQLGSRNCRRAGHRHRRADAAPPRHPRSQQSPGRPAPSPRPTTGRVPS